MPANFTGLLTPALPGSLGSHGDSTQATTISCNLCHNLTVTTAGNYGSGLCNGCHTTAAGKTYASIANKANHLNGTVDVSFANTKVISKAQLRDASFSLNSSSTGWHRTGVYKAGYGSFDQAKQSLNVAPAYTTGSGCSSISCHFNQPNVDWKNTTPIDCNSCHLSNKL